MKGAGSPTQREGCRCAAKAGDSLMNFERELIELCPHRCRSRGCPVLVEGQPCLQEANELSGSKRQRTVMGQKSK